MPAPSQGVVRQAEPDERDEALRILYRLHAVWIQHDHPPTALKAVEELIKSTTEAGISREAHLIEASKRWRP